MWSRPHGEEFYRWALKAATTTEMTPDEVHALGQRELERLHAESGHIIQRARVDAETIITQSRADGDRLREEIRAKARTEADHIVKNAERQIQLETARALEQIRREAVDLSVMIASKIIQRNLSKEDNERLIDDALKQVESRRN